MPVYMLINFLKQNEAASKEISALKLVIKYIKEYNLDNEYPVAPLENRLEKIESHMAARTAAKKRPAFSPATKSQQQQRQKRNKLVHGWTTSSAGPSVAPSNAAGTSSTAAPFQQLHLQAPGLEADGPVPYMNPSAGLCRFTGVPMGFPGNIGPPPMPYLQSMEPQLPMRYAHGGFGLQPQYPPAYFPQ